MAYIGAEGSAGPYIEAVSALHVEPGRAQIRHIDLIEMHRDRMMYEWITVNRILLND